MVAPAPELLLIPAKVATPAVTFPGTRLPDEEKKNYGPCSHASKRPRPYQASKGRTACCVVEKIFADSRIDVVSPSPGGPRFAKRTFPLGELTCGGRGEALGRGEGERYLI